MFTLFALFAFAANSVFCRMALGDETIDASSFTVIRLLSGVFVLILISQFTSDRRGVSSKGSWISAMMLFTYAVTFSFAYVSLDTGTGALILFGVVQITMILVSVFSGTKLHVTEWAGATIAFIGFVYLMMPGLTTPSISGFLLMSAAGVAWGVYTLNGRKSVNPLRDTTFNFARTVPFVVMLAAASIPFIEVSSKGFMLAVLSGALASGVGYTIWYIALGGLSATVAAVVQLLLLFSCWCRLLPRLVALFLSLRPYHFV